MCSRSKSKDREGLRAGQTSKELCTSVSSRSRARHFLPVPCGGGGHISGMRCGGLRICLLVFVCVCVCAHAFVWVLQRERGLMRNRRERRRNRIHALDFLWESKMVQSYIKSDDRDTSSVGHTARTRKTAACSAPLPSQRLHRSYRPHCGSWWRTACC